jgi:acetyl esterase/lipase
MNPTVILLAAMMATIPTPPGAGATAPPSKGGHLSTNDSLHELLNHPALADFSRMLLPWDGRAYDETMRLKDLGSLLPYHTQVDPTTVVGALNRMIDDIGQGQRVFYEFYSGAQKRSQPARENTGLFFFRGKPGAPFAVISPGGGFSYVGSLHEGFPYAAEISARGYNAFVLRYRAGYGGTTATEDLAAAISYIFRNADMLGVGTQHYSLWGSSAGARMAAAIGSHGIEGFSSERLPRPSAVVLAYTAHSDFLSTEPPTFVVVGEQDTIAPPSAMEKRIAALRRNGVEVEYHKYKNLGHGFGPGTGTSADGWIDAAVRFWEKAQHQSQLNHLKGATESPSASATAPPRTSSAP